MDILPNVDKPDDLTGFSIRGGLEIGDIISGGISYDPLSRKLDFLEFSFKP